MKNKILILGVISTFAFISCKKEVIVTPSTNAVENTNVAEDVKSATQATADLPSKAVETINNYYSQDNIASYEIKNIPVIGKSFEVKFNDGAEIDFDENGNWHDWKDAKGLPNGVLPDNIKQYITKNYSATMATSIEKDGKKINVDLANDIDLEFDLNGNFVRIDK